MGIWHQNIGSLCVLKKKQQQQQQQKRRDLQRFILAKFGDWYSPNRNGWKIPEPSMNQPGYLAATAYLCPVLGGF